MKIHTFSRFYALLCAIKKFIQISILPRLIPKYLRVESTPMKVYGAHYNLSDAKPTSLNSIVSYEI